MSANRMVAYRAIKTKTGRMFAQEYPTATYKEFYERCMPQLEVLDWPFDTEQRLLVRINAYFSNRASDLDNVAKPSLDLLQKAFGSFNDKFVYRLEMDKHLVKRGEEKLEIEITEFNDVSQEKGRSAPKD